MIGWGTYLYVKAKELGKKVVEGSSSKSGENLADLMASACGCVYAFETNFNKLDGDTKLLISVAEDIEEQIAREELGGRKKRKREVDDWLGKEKELRKEFEELKKEKGEKKLSRFTKASGVVKLSKRVKQHLKNKNNFGDLVLETEKGRDEIMLDKIYGAGYKRHLDDIWRCVEPPGHQMIGIYGADKAGKTTLAKHIHNKVIDKTEDRVYWVRVSDNTSEKTLQDDISNAIGLSLGENDVRIRASRLYAALKAKKNFVLVLDNFRKYIDLETVGYPVREDGCKLIITTVSEKVCRQVGCQTTIEVKMTEDEAWEMFKEVYGQNSPPDGEYFKMQVRKRCGFPQRIIKFARNLEVSDCEFSD